MTVRIVAAVCVLGALLVPLTAGGMMWSAMPSESMPVRVVVTVLVGWAALSAYGLGLRLLGALLSDWWGK